MNDGSTRLSHRHNTAQLTSNSGASSTGGKNIQLDLQQTFRGPEELKILPDEDGKALVYVSVSHSIAEFNKFLGSHSLFVPHGQCSHVHIGGHVQTGGMTPPVLSLRFRYKIILTLPQGYGQLGRSFGLFGDHVRTIYLIDSDSKELVITQSSDPELFYALLGGSPGNFGVITHITLAVHRDADYNGSMGLRALFLYNKPTAERLISYVAEMADTPSFPRNYDLCVSVLSSSFPLRALWPGLDSEIKESHPDIYGQDNMLGWPRAIIVYAQWVPFTDEDRAKGPDWKWFEKLQSGNPIRVFQDGVVTRPMSELTKMWLFQDVREFDLPYEKRTYLTKSTTLGKDHWPEWVSGRIDELVAPVDNFCWLSCQIQCFGGKDSAFTTNANNGTSYSWRDSTVCATLDAFHWSDHKQTAVEWQTENDQVGLGEGGVFSKQDRRVLWGSYGDFDMDRVWDTYHEDREKYERLGRTRSRMDPYGTFTPNTFCVKKA